MKRITSGLLFRVHAQDLGSKLALILGIRDPTLDPRYSCVSQLMYMNAHIKQLNSNQSSGWVGRSSNNDKLATLYVLLLEVFRSTVLKSSGLVTFKKIYVSIESEKNSKFFDT